jgi:hypothetical protein
MGQIMGKKKLKILIPLILILLFFGTACFVLDELGSWFYDDAGDFQEIDEKWNKSVADAEEEMKKEEEIEEKKEEEDTYIVESGAEEAEMLVGRIIEMGFYKQYYDGVEKADWILRDEKGEIIEVGKFGSPEEEKELKGTVVLEEETEGGLPLTIIINLDTGKVSGSSDYTSAMNVEWEGNTYIGIAMSCNCDISGNMDLNTKKINASCLGTYSFFILGEEAEEDYKFDIEGTLIEYDTKAIGTAVYEDGSSDNWQAILVSK